ncbi:hypothetical protein [Micromonospora aurantiaca]|uniref:hypothetical protein n=1 Tax=Micromonospora aurantiaca (nom. illeg.) TaxID=47850 RepID=UPI0011CD5717|nr:hypothetical protein [Micromonospora aurantiaca]
MTIRVTPMTPPVATPARIVPASGWPLLHLIKKVIPWPADPPANGIPPTQRPFDREPATVDGIDRYAPGAPVWAYIGGAWLTAYVADTTGSSALVSYPAPGSAETKFETVHVSHLQLRDRPRRASYGGPPSANGSPDSADVPDAGHARVILDVHCPDEHGMCTACVYLAHFCWAPCPRARQAMTALGIAPMAQFGGQ